MLKFRQARMHRRSRRAALMATTAVLALISAPALPQTLIDGTIVEVPGTQASPWNLPGSLTVGDTGTGTLNIGVGGTPGVVSSTNGVVGNAAGSSGMVAITGAGSSWTTGGNSLFVGNTGTGSLSVTGGGLLNAGNSVLGFDPQGNGTVNVSGTGSIFGATQLTVGSHGTGDLVISAGGTVMVDTIATLGGFADGHGTLTVTGTGSSLQAISALGIGSTGTGTASVLAGASIVSNGGNIGGAATGVGQLTIDGTGTSWMNSGGVLVGNSGNGTMAITGGGLVVNTNATLGAAMSGVGTVTVTGLLSSWVNTGGLTIGVSGKGSLTVADKASVLADFVSLGTMTGGDGTLLVTGLASALSSTNALTVADFGRGSLTIADGAMVVSTDAYIAQNTNSTGSIAVTGAGSQLYTYGNLGVGIGGDGTLRITGGGAVHTFGAGFVGYTPGSNGHAVVSGAGSSWDTSGDIYVGGDSGNAGLGQLAIADGGQVIVNTGNGMVYLGVAAGSFGILAIGGESPTPGYNPSAAPGRLDAAGVHIGTSAALQFNHTSDNYVFAPVISGTGSIDYFAGTTHFTADSSGFTGSAGIIGGRMVVDGKLGGSIFLQRDGILSGTGTIFNLTVYNGGTVAPGNSIGTLTVAGGAIFEPTSIYQVEVNAAGQSDKIVVGGLAQVTGGTVQVLAGVGNYAPTTTYTILSAAGGRAGTFDTVTSNFAFLTPSLSYDPNNVYLTLTRNAIGFAAVGATPNQQATGTGVGSLQFVNPIYNAVLFLSDAQARDAFDRLSGEIHASTKTVLIEDSRQVRNAAIDRLRAAFADIGAASSPVMAYDAAADRFAAASPSVERLALWSAGFGSWGRTNGDGNAARIDRSSGGFVIGADASVLGTARLGVLGGYSRTSFSADARASSGTSDNYHVGLYGGAQWNAVSLRGGVAYTWHDISSHRTVTFPGFSNTLDGSSRAGTAQVFGELGYGLRAGHVAIEPFANLAHVSLRNDDVTESGGAAALTAQSSRTDTTFSTLGLRAAHDVWVGGITGTIRATLGWRHAFGDTTPSSTLAFAGSGPFTVAGVPIARDAAVVEGGLDLTLSPTAVLGLTYGGQFASAAVDQTVRAELNVKF